MKQLILTHRPGLARRRVLALLLLAAGWRSARGQAANPDDPEASPRWQQVRKSLFGTRAIVGGSDSLVALEAPQRAEDAAVVPIAMRARIDQQPGRSIRRLVLVIDNNPSPIAAKFDFTPASGRADIETRVRIDEYTHVRAIAELDDGQLHMATRFVKASGGCSAPSAKDPVAARAMLGRMRLQVVSLSQATALARAQLMISHPNSSGLVMDQLTRQYMPAHFVRSVEVSYAGKPVLSADLDFAISENPHLRFDFVAKPPGGELRARVVDSQDLQFEQAIVMGMPS